MRRSLGEIGITVLGLALCAAGCGGDGGLGGPGAQFVGSWQYIPGETTGSLTCGMSTIDETPRGNKIFATGVDAAIVDLTASDLDSAIYCNFAFDVKGTIATARTDQTCALTGARDVIAFNPPERGDTPKDPPDGWTFALTSATTAEEVARTTVMVFDPQPDDTIKTSYCDFEMVAHLKRVSKD